MRRSLPTVVLILLSAFTQTTGLADLRNFWASVVIGLLLIATGIYWAWPHLGALTHLSGSLSHERMVAHANDRIADGEELKRRLIAARSPAEIGDVAKRLSAWDDATIKPLKRYHERSALIFGDNAFRDVLPTDQDKLLMVLKAKLSRLEHVREGIDPSADMNDLVRREYRRAKARNMARAADAVQVRTRSDLILARDSLVEIADGDLAESLQPWWAERQELFGRVANERDGPGRKRAGDIRVVLPAWVTQAERRPEDAPAMRGRIVETLNEYIEALR